MSKIHPAENHKSLTIKPSDQEPGPSVLTVWKRSSMSFQGTDGFTVFDNRGRLVFRVDNYTRKSWSVEGGGLLLMDGSGKALLTLKPQLLIMQNQWSAYRGEEDERCSSTRAFTMRRPTSSLIRRSHCPCEAEVFLGGENITTASRRNQQQQQQRQRQRQPDFKSEGSFRRRNCKISVAATGQMVANISRKRINTTLLLNDDVFTLTVQPGFDPALVMAFVIVLDRICYKSFAPVMCSY